MSNTSQTNLNEKDNFVSEEDTEISLPAANFEAAQPMSVQPVIPFAPVTGDPTRAFPQQPQVVYVAQPTVVEPKRGWGWIPVTLALLLVATIAGVFIGAELYKRSIYAESSAPYSNGDVSPYANSIANVKSDKADEENSLADKKEMGLSGNVKSEQKQLNSVSNGFASIQKTDLRENGDYSATVGENEGEEYNQEETADEETKKADVNQAEKGNQQVQPDDEEAPPPPVQRKPKELEPRKVENIKDTENIVPPQRNMPD